MSANDAIALAYVAGIVDGEGSIVAYWSYRNGRSKHWSVDLIINMCSEEVLLFCQKTLGTGKIYLHNRKNPKWKNIYGFYLRKRGDLLNALLKIQPFLILKKPQVNIAIKLLNYRLKRPHKLLTQKEEELTDELLALNAANKKVKRRKETTNPTLYSQWLEEKGLRALADDYGRFRCSRCRAFISVHSANDEGNVRCNNCGNELTITDYGKECPALKGEKRR